jgi:murein DD-endopeptidase MepM/ murein hydrolase activator NlpD
VGDGVVERVAEDEDGRELSGYGNAVVIRHDEGDLRSLSAHLSRALVRPGERVAAGQVIGCVGNTSNGRFPRMGSHLHLEIRRALPGGESPFPGPYRVHNLDPERWLAERGIAFDQAGLPAESYPAHEGERVAGSAGEPGHRESSGAPGS